MKNERKPSGYWKDKELCRIEALNFKYRSDFQKKSGGAYSAAIKYGWYDDICGHMESKIDPDKSFDIGLIYIAFFNDGFCYVGQTNDFERRKHEHLTTDCVIHNHIVKISEEPKWWIIEDNLFLKNLNNREIYWEKCCSKSGFKLLNKIKCGSGGRRNGNWTKKLCHLEALKYTTRTDFKNNSGGACTAAIKYGWYDEITTHMEEILKPRGFWKNKENRLEELKKYTTRKDFYTYSSGAYAYMKINGLLNEISYLSTGIQKPRGYWTKERCHDEALKYNNLTDFKIKSHKAYHQSLRKCWLKEITSHLIRKKLVNNYWDQGKMSKRSI